MLESPFITFTDNDFLYFAETVNAIGTEESVTGIASVSALGIVTVTVTKIVNVTESVTENVTVTVIVTAKRNVESTEAGHVKKTVIATVIGKGRP